MSIMKRFISIILILVAAFNIGFSTTSACSMNSHASTWHCSNNSPGISLKPGEEGNITIYCCYTSPYASIDDEYTLQVKIIENYTRSVQQPNGEWETENIFYSGSGFIDAIYYNKTVHPYEDIPITIHFKLPPKSEYYEAGETLKARTDIMLNTGGSFILNNVVVNRIVIPDNWRRPIIDIIVDFVKENPIVIGSAILIFTVILMALHLINKV